MEIQEHKIILAHDSLTQLGGAEKVVDVFHEMFPESPLYVLVVSKKIKKLYKDWNIKTSLLQVLYTIIPYFQYLLPFIPLAVALLRIPENSIILSSSSGFIKAIRKPKNSLHINYCHTPTRFLWTDSLYVEQEVPFMVRPFAQLFLWWMKWWDVRAADRVDYFIANSAEVQNRISRYYHRDSVVIPPPIEIDFWHQTKPKENYFLLAGRLQAHKKNELIVEIFNELGLPLHVVGTGRQEEYLRSIAKPNIVFYGRVSNEELRDQYSAALGFIYPQIEDAGLMPLEAALCKTATIGIAMGGSLETIIPGVTGEFFTSYDAEEIKKIIGSWDVAKYDSLAMKRHVEKFSKEVFKQKMIAYIRSCMSDVVNNKT